MISSTVRRLCAFASALALTGCISLFPNEPPANLYRFGLSSPPSAAPAGTSSPFGVLDGGIAFDREAANDRILTVTGNEVAYIKSARWAVAAPLLFRAAMQHAFDAYNGPARLIDRAEASPVDYVLKLDVRRFEARYEGGPAAAPTVVVRVRAALNKFHDHSVVGDRMFEAKVTASDNRVSAITDAFDQATSRVLGDVTVWVNQPGPA